MLLRKIGLPLLALLLIAKVIGVVMRGPSPFAFDAGYYWELGSLVADGDGLLMQRPIAFRTPGYPWLVGLIKTVFPSPLLALVCIQALLWVFTVGLTAAIAFDLSRDRRAVWIVIGIATIMISSVVYVSTVLTETFFAFSLVLHLWSVARFTRLPSVPGGVAVGITLGLAILIRPVAMLIWVADAIYVLASWFWSRDGVSPKCCWHRGLISATLAALTCIGCLSPWLARNHALFGKVMMTEFVGRNIWIVTFQDGSGAGLAMPESDDASTLKTQLGAARWTSMKSDQTWRDTWTVSKSLTASGMSDPAADRLMKRVATDAIKTSPMAFGKKTLRRMINFWRTRATELPIQVADLEPDDDLAEELYDGQPIWGVKVAPVDTALRYRWSNWLAGNTLLLVITISATMLLIWRRATRPHGLWLASLLCYFTSVTAVLEIPGYRYRMIVEPVVLLVIALCLTQVLFPTDDPPTATNPE